MINKRSTYGVGFDVALRGADPTRFKRWYDTNSRVRDSRKA